MAKITFLGIDAMGSRIAISLLKAGHEVAVWNHSRTKAKLLENAGAKVADTPRIAVKEAEFVISMMRDDQASQQVWLDPEIKAIADLSMDAVAIKSSTLILAWTKELREHFQKQQIAFLDAPATRTRPETEAAKLIYFVGREEQTFAKAKPVLEAMDGTLQHVGAVGMRSG